MAIIKMKPRSAGTRHRTKVVTPGLHKGNPVKSLTDVQKRTAGRNNMGRITTRHRGGGHKQRYRIIDFKRSRDGIPAHVERIEYDPNRTAHIALVVYQDGVRSYVIATKDMKPGDRVLSGESAPISSGNTLPLHSIPVGTVINCIELKPGKGAQLVRSAGASAQLVAREGDRATIRLRSKEVRTVSADCRATVGVISNGQHNLQHLGKAGAKRWRGIRPTVRGVAMNPVDHPHGGGEGRTSGGRHPVTPWGVPTKGYKTRKNKWTQSSIVRSRHQS